MKKKMMYLLAIIFPWVVLLIDDNPGGAIVALFLQLTVILWPVAAIWAMNVISESSKKKPD